MSVVSRNSYPATKMKGKGGSRVIINMNFQNRNIDTCFFSVQCAQLAWWTGNSCLAMLIIGRGSDNDDEMGSSQRN